MSVLKILHIPYKVTREEEENLIQTHTPEWIVTSVGIFKILHITDEETEETEKELIRTHNPKWIITSAGIRLIGSSETQNYPEVNECKLKIRRYLSKQFITNEPKNLCHLFRNKQINWIIFISFDDDNSQDNRKLVLDILKTSPLQEKVMITNEDSGDISFMPCETFWRSCWTVVNGDPEKIQTNKSETNLSCDKIKDEIFSAYIQDYLIREEIRNLKQILGVEKSAILSASNTISRIRGENSESIKKALDKIKYLQSTDTPKKKIENMTIKTEPRNLKISHDGFIRIRRVCGKIFDILTENKKALQHFKHAIYFAFETKTSEEFQRKLSSELCELFQIRSYATKKLRKRLEKHGLLYLYTSLLKDPNVTEKTKRTEHLESELYQFLQNEEFNASTDLVKELKILKNEKEHKLDEIKTSVHRALETGKVTQDKELRDTGYIRVPEILKEACNSLYVIRRWTEKIGIQYEEVIRIFGDGICKALDGEMAIFEEILNLLDDENQKTIIKEHLLADLRKEDYKLFKNKYKEDCKKSFVKLSGQKIALIVASKYESTHDIRPIEIDRTLHTGKWTHCGLDGVTKRMIKVYMSQSKENKEKLVDFCNTIYHSYPLAMSGDIRKTCLRIKYDKFREAELKYIYRPISMATQFFNLIDKAIHLRLLNWIWQYQSLPENSFSYQKRKSAPWCRNKLLLKIAELIRAKKFWYVTSVDFKQAYENVHPLKLCQLMTLKGIPSNIISWVWFALSQRELTLDGADDVRFSRSKGVPQGSSMSPLLFNIYTALIHQFASEETLIYQYTDDVLVLGIDDSSLQQARRKSEAVCYQVVSLMIKYDAILKKESEVNVKFVGLEINNPQSELDCTDIEKIFGTFFTSMMKAIHVRLEETTKEDIHPADAWHQYHIRIRPLFSKVFVSLQSLCKIADPDNNCKFLCKTIKDLDDLNIFCLKKCLLQKGNDYPVEPDALRYEFGEFPAQIQMEEAFANEFSRYYYYGLFDGNIDLPAIDEIKKHLSPVPRKPNYPRNITVKDETIKKGHWGPFDFVVYTDGSVGKFKEEYVAGAGAYFAKKPEGFNFEKDRVEDEEKKCIIGASIKLSSNLMISSVEIIATIIAIEKIEEYLQAKQIKTVQEILIVVDREEALMHLRERQRTRHIHYYAEVFKNKVRALSQTCNVTLGKVKAHSRSDENNLVDEFAKKVSRNRQTFSNQFSKLNLVDFKRMKHREFRKKYQSNLNRENDNNFPDFRFKPWFKQKRARALQLCGDTCRKYIEDRLECPNNEELKNWMYFYQRQINNS